MQVKSVGAVVRIAGSAGQLDLTLAEAMELLNHNCQCGRRFECPAVAEARVSGAVARRKRIDELKAELAALTELEANK
jgi:hypothetical protein